jgi:hypothetical protein
MNKRAFLTFLTTFVSILMASCNPTNATPDYRATFQPEITKTEEDNTLIVTDNFSAVILTSEYLYARRFWVTPTPPDGYWTPKVNQVLELESKLEEFVVKNGSRFHSGNAPSKAELSTFGRQYFGLTNRQGSFIIGSLICPRIGEDFDLQNQVIAAITGGGDCVFHVIYDPDKQEFINFGANDTR